jgi:hypothetical protein
LGFDFVNFMESEYFRISRYGPALECAQYPVTKKNQSHACVPASACIAVKPPSRALVSGRWWQLSIQLEPGKKRMDLGFPRLRELLISGFAIELLANLNRAIRVSVWSPT